MSRLAGKIAVVTGGNSGIGFATAQRFLREGAKVIITGRRQQAVDDAVEALGDGATGMVADAGSIEDADKLLDSIKAEFGKIDVLFLNAGIAPFGPITSVSADSFDQVFNTNVKGLFFTLQKAVPHLNSGASVILTGSVVHKEGYPGAAIYAATKAAVRSLGQSAAAELAPIGIRVNILSPGPIETPIFGKGGLEKEQLEGMSKQIQDSVPLGRFGKADEMANAALFLASEESSFVTGADLQADGGYSQTVA